MRPVPLTFLWLLAFAPAPSALAANIAPDWGATYQLDLGWQDSDAFFSASSTESERGHLAASGNVYEQYSSAEGPVVGGGYGEAQVLLRNGALNGIEPSLRAYIRTGGGGHDSWRGGARARAQEVYEYSGSTPVTVDLDVTLHGSFSSAATMYAAVSIFGGRGVYEPDPAQHPLLASAVTPLLESGQTASSSLSFIVAPGDVFTLWAQLSLNATGSHEFADALSTLSLSFRDPSHLAPQSVVPLPAPHSLLLIGLAALTGLRRRGSSGKGGQINVSGTKR